MQKPIAILAVLATLAALLWLWQPWANETTPEPPGHDPAVAAPGPRERAAPPPAPAIVDANAPTPAERTQVPVEASAEPHDGPLLRVIDGRTRAPVAGAGVRFLQLADLTAEQRAELGSMVRPEAAALDVVARLGRKLTADRHGEVGLPRIDSEAVAMGRDGELRGILRLRPGQSEGLELELWPVRALRVIVRDAAGEPAPAVPVAVVVRADDRWRTVHYAMTGADGRVDTDAAADLSRLMTRRSESPAETRGEVRVDLPLREVPRVEVDLAEPPAEPIELRLPPLGAVVVTLVHAKPELLDTATVTLADLDAPPNVQDSSQAPRVVDGRAEFPLVGLGLRLRATARIRQSTDEWTTDFTGPTAPGQTVFARLELVEQYPVVVATLRDQEGEPMARMQLRTMLHAEHGGSSSSSYSGTEADADSRIRIPIEDGLGTDARRTLQLDAEDGQVVKVVLPVLRAGENDLGVLTLRSAPLVCGGVVQDRDGKPISGATIEVERKEVYDTRRADAFFWNRIDVEPVRTGDDGRFEMTGHVGTEAHAISARCERFLPVVREPLAVGAAGLVFVLDRAAVLEGRIEGGAFQLRRMVSVEVVGSDGNRTTSRELDGGDYAFRELDPGTVDLRVLLFGDAEPLVTKRGISVRAGETTTVAPIDLRELLRTVSFRVADPDGRPVDDAVALLLHPGEPAERGGLFLERGHGRALTRHRPLDLLVYADGFRNARATDVQDGQQIVLRRDLAVTLRLPPGAAPPAPPAKLHVQLEPASGAPTRTPYRIVSQSRSSSFSGSVPWLHGANGVLDAGGAVTLRLPEPGEYRAVWSMSAGEDHQRRSVGNAETIAVLDQDGEQTWVAKLTAETIEAARSSFR